MGILTYTKWRTQVNNNQESMQGYVNYLLNYKYKGETAYERWLSLPGNEAGNVSEFVTYILERQQHVVQQHQLEPHQHAKIMGVKLYQDAVQVILDNGDNMPLSGVSSEQVVVHARSEQGDLLHLSSGEALMILNIKLEAVNTIQKIIVEGHGVFAQHKDGSQRRIGFGYKSLEVSDAFDQFRDVYIQASKVMIELTDGTTLPIGTITAEERELIVDYIINNKQELIVIYQDGEIKNMGTLKLPQGAGQQLAELMEHLSESTPFQELAAMYMWPFRQAARQLQYEGVEEGRLMVRSAEGEHHIYYRQEAIGHLALDEQHQLVVSLDNKQSIRLGRLETVGDRAVKQVHVVSNQLLIAVMEDGTVVELGKSDK